MIDLLFSIIPIELFTNQFTVNGVPIELTQYQQTFIATLCVCVFFVICGFVWSLIGLLVNNKLMR